jgi:hypothetical protein
MLMRFLIFLAIAAALLVPARALAQTGQASDASVDAQEARTDALLGTLNSSTPEPLTNLYATAPGLEQQIPAPQWRVNLLAPLAYNSNAEEIARGGTQTFASSPFGGVSWAAPLGSLPFRVTLNASSVFNRYFEASSADNNRVTVSGRLQYVDPGNDQAFSPYFAIVPRWSYDASLSDLTESRQDFNLGINKRFNFDGSFRPLAISGDTSAETVWSLGLTAFIQRRLRDPQLSSSAAFVIPSLSYVISKDWNASLAVEFLGRWYDPNMVGATNRDFEALPIGTLEYVIPTSFLGGDRMAKILGRPAVDLQGSHLNVWSTAPGVTYNQWQAQAAIKMGWSF